MPGYQTTPLSQCLNITGFFYKCFFANEGLLCSAPQNLSGAQGDRTHHLIAALVTAAGKETAGGGQALPTHPASPAQKVNPGASAGITLGRFSHRGQDVCAERQTDTVTR